MALDLHDLRQIAERVCGRQDMVDACQQRDLGVIIAILGHHGISQGQLAGLTGIPQGRLSEYKTGKRLPTLNTLEAFADGLGMPEHARRALGLATASEANAALAADGPPDRSAMPDLLTLAWMAGSLTNHMDRRAVLQLAATLVAAPLLGVEEPAERLAYALRGPAEVQDDTIVFLEQRTIGLHRIEPMFQARLVHRSIMAHLREVTALLEGHPGDLSRSRLARIAGESAVLAAWTAWDLGEAAHSSRMYRITEAASRAANDPVIMACANTYRSYATLGPNAHEDSRKILADARKYLPERGEDATRAWVMAREAEEAATIGEPIAEDLIKQAVDAFNRARPQRERPWTRFLDEPRMNSLELSTYTQLGKEKRVHELADNLLSTVTPASKRAALINADVGIAAVHLGDATSGINYGRRSLEAVRESETSFGLWRLEELARALASEARARELRAEIKQMRRALASPH
jgi:transcriptional regulator with XRE-family HTH domain